MVETTTQALAAPTKSFLQFVELASLTNWSVRFALETKFNYNPIYPLHRLGSFLRRNKTEVIIEDNVEYRRVTIRMNNRGVLLRDTELGQNIGTKRQFRLTAGQFVLSKIDARNGAMGIAPQELDGATITADFLAFDVDSTLINPYFLALVTSTNEFIRFCQSCSSGTTNRQRLDENLFLNVQIPLPSLVEQAQLVTTHQSRIQLAHDKREEANSLNNSGLQYLDLILGIATTQNERQSGRLHFVESSALSRWDTTFALQSVSIKTKYQKVRVGTLVEQFMRDDNRKSIRINSSNYPNKDFHYIGMENVEKASGRLVDPPIVKGLEIKSQTLRVPHNFMIYGKLRPYLNKYWLNSSSWEDVICSSEFFVFSINESKIHKEYFVFLISSQLVQTQLKNNMSGARMPRMNEEIFLNLEIPIPSIEQQRAIASHLNELQEMAQQLRTAAEALETEAVGEFEATIFQ
jgi:type I restriction enzyme S subunit